MQKSWWLGALALVALIGSLYLLRRSWSAEPRAMVERSHVPRAGWHEERPGQSASAGEGLLPGIALEDGVTIGEPAVLHNVSVFPVYGPSHDIGAYRTLAAASAGGGAVVRETANNPGNAEVHRLSFSNDGDLPLFVPGGTVVGGGFQDRLLSRDLVLAPHAVAQLEVQCAERERWSPSRAGVDTKGRFAVLASLAGSEVQATAELYDDQTRVWERVAAVNRAHCKAPPTGTLAATLSDPALSQRRDQLAGELVKNLDARPMQDQLVGMAYTVDGSVRSVRVFASSQLFHDMRETLGRTAALDALAGPPAAQAVAKRASREASGQDDVIAFVRAIREHPEGKSERISNATVKTVYLYGREGYGAIASRIGGEKGGDLPLSASFTAKPGPIDAGAPAACAYD